MVILMVVIVVSFIIAFCCSETETTSSSDSNLVLDIDMMQKDGIKVTFGELSQREYKKRINSDYYMVEKGETLADKRRREKSKRIAASIEEMNKEWASRRKPLE